MRSSPSRLVFLLCAASAIPACDGGTIAGPEPGSTRATFTPCYETDCDPDGGGDNPTQNLATYSYTIYSLEARRETSPNVYEKEVTIVAEGKALDKVQTTVVDLEVTRMSNCTGTREPVDRKSATGSGSPATVTVEISTRYPAFKLYKVEGIGTFRFTPVPGATGGGTYQKTVAECY